MGGKIIPRIRLTSAKVLIEVEAELGKTVKRMTSEKKGGRGWVVGNSSFLTLYAVDIKVLMSFMAVSRNLSFHCC